MMQSVGITVNGSTNAVSACGSRSMSLSLIACQPRMLEPSKPRPSSNVSSSSFETGMVKSCQMPGKSIKRRSIALMSRSRHNARTDWGVKAAMIRCLQVPEGREGWCVSDVDTKNRPAAGRTDADRGDRLEFNMIPKPATVANNLGVASPEIFKRRNASFLSRETTTAQKLALGQRPRAKHVSVFATAIVRRLTGWLQLAFSLGGNEPHQHDAVVGLGLNAVDDRADDADADAAQEIGGVADLWHLAWVAANRK